MYLLKFPLFSAICFDKKNHSKFELALHTKVRNLFKMQTDNLNILTIRNNIVLTKDDIIVQSVIKEKRLYDTLVLNIADESFDKPFVQSETFEIFWKILGKTVTTLRLFNIKSLPIKLEKHFTNLQELRLYSYETFEVVSVELYQKNSQLETVSWFNTHYSTNCSDHRLHEIFVEILEHCKSLKSFTFDIFLPLEANRMNEFFMNINMNILQMDEIIFDCVPIPLWCDYENYYWIIKRIEMELIRSEECHKLIIKPLILLENLIEGQNVCEENCELNHQVFRSESVTRFIYSLEPRKRCQAYYKSCFTSFVF